MYSNSNVTEINPISEHLSITLDVIPRKIFSEFYRTYNEKIKPERGIYTFSNTYVKPNDLTTVSYACVNNYAEDRLLKFIRSTSFAMRPFNRSQNKLSEISRLEDDWNCNGATKFSDDLINMCKTILVFLKVEPDIFPTARNSIQFEYEKENGEYLEFEIFIDRILVLKMDENENADEYTIEVDEHYISKLKQLVDEFYGSFNKVK